MNNSNNALYNFRMDGRAGVMDYKFENLYFGRSETEGKLARQFYDSEGAFKVANPVGQSNDWIMAVNLEMDLPGPLPLKLYTDFGTYAGAATVGSLEDKVLFGGGLALMIIRDIAEFYLPLFESRDIRKYQEANGIETIDQIRFVINLKALSPFKIRDTF